MVLHSSTKGRGSAADKLASPSATAEATPATAGGDHAGPSTPLGLHPPTVLAEPASAAAARISSAAKTAAGAAAAGLAAARDGVKKLQQAAAAPAGSAGRAAGEITAAAEGQGVAGGHMGDRLGSDIGLAGERMWLGGGGDVPGLLGA